MFEPTAAPSPKLQRAAALTEEEAESQELWGLEMKLHKYKTEANGKKVTELIGVINDTCCSVRLSSK